MTFLRRSALTRRYGLTALFALAAIAQTLAYYVYLRDDPGNYNGAGAFGDQVAYIELAQQILRGQWEGRVHYLPGYPAVIALAQVLFGEPRLGIALLQAGVYAALVFGAHHLAARAFGDRAAPWAAGLVGLNPAIGSIAAQALTELLTGALLFATVAALYAWSGTPRRRYLVLAGILGAAMAYHRSDYLGMVLALAVVVFVVARRQGQATRPALGSALLVVLVSAALVAPWLVRYWVVTGRPSLYNESPVSNLTLMGTWFRVFDDATFARLQEIVNDPGLSREQAIERAGQVGPRPDLSRRYLEQVRGPYERPLGETLALAVENARAIGPRYVVNHFALAPVLIWAARTPVRQADVAALPTPARWTLWGAQLALVGLALGQAAWGLRRPETFALALAFLAAVAFLTAVHLLIAVDERFTAPALPLIGTFAGGAVAGLLARRRGAVAAPERRLAAA